VCRSSKGLWAPHPFGGVQEAVGGVPREWLRRPSTAAAVPAPSTGHFEAVPQTRATRLSLGPAQARAPGASGLGESTWCRLSRSAGGEREGEAHGPGRPWASSRLHFHLDQRCAKPRRAAHSHTLAARGVAHSGRFCALCTCRSRTGRCGRWRGSTSVRRPRVLEAAGFQCTARGRARPGRGIPCGSCAAVRTASTSRSTRTATRPTDASGSRPLIRSGELAGLA
jgi:hypothetical protein